MTSSLGSASRKSAFILAGLLLAGAADAGTWTIVPDDALPTSKKETFQTRYPEIQNADKLEELLRELGRAESFLKLEAVYENGTWQIHAQRARVIGDVKLNLSTRAFQSSLQTNLYKYIGQADSPEIRAKLRSEVKDYLAYRGFHNAQVDLTFSDYGDELLRYTFNVEEDYPCLIREVSTGFTLPMFMSTGISVGDICDQEAIEEAVLELEDDLQNDGYNQQKILKPEVKYDKSSNTAAIYIPGTLGKKIVFKVDSPSQNFWDADLEDIDSSVVEPDAFGNEIVRRYRNEGYDDVVVDAPRREEIGDDEIRYVFKVHPGTRYRITNIQVEGMEHFDREQAMKIMDFDSLLRLDSPPLNQDSIRKGIDNLKAAYNADGFWDAQVHFPRIAKDRATGQASLVFVVTEGKQRILEKVDITGNTVYTTDEILELLETEPEKPLIWGDLLGYEQKLKTAYGKKGYLYASFKINLVQKTEFRSIPTTVSIAITEEKRVKFGDISINGLVLTRPEVVTRELRFQTGDWYDPEKVEETRAALIRLGLFSSVSIIPSDSDALSELHETIPYSLVFREGKPGNVSFGPGWSFDQGGRFAIESSYNNIGGLNRQVFMKGSISEERRQDGFTNKTLLGRSLGGGYVEPYIFNWPINASITLNHRAEAGIKRWELSRQGELAFEHTLRHWLPGAKFVGFYGQKITDVEAEDVLMLNLIETGDVRQGRVGFRFNLDRRNDPSWPTSGYILNLENAWARYYFGGDLQYYRWSISHSMYFNVAENFVLAGGYSFTAFEDVERKGSNPDVLPTTERLHAGGAETNRGFRRQSLGPKIDYNEDNVISGGSRLAVFKVELRYQVIRDTAAITTFVDASNTFFSEKEFDRFTDAFANANPSGQQPAVMTGNAPYGFQDLFSDPKMIWDKNYLSYGLAFNYLTPLGSFNLSYGLPWKRCATENKCSDPRGNPIEKGILGGVFHINVGANF